MNRNVEHLLTRINEENIDQDFQQNLIIFDEKEKKVTEEFTESKCFQLFKDTRSTSLSTKKKGTRFSREQVFEIKMLISKYPDNHVKIRKALKIPSSTFNRLSRENDEESRHRNTTIRKSSSKHLLLSRKRNISKNWCNLQQFQLQWKIFKKSADDIFE